MKNLVNSVSELIQAEKCRKTGKVIFFTEQSANHRAKCSNKEMSVYRCPHCGYYHLTSVKRYEDDGTDEWYRLKEELGQEDSSLIKFI